MSQYINFFIRCEDNLIPLVSYSCNSYIYQGFHHHVPYGKIKSIDESILNDVKMQLNDQIKRFQSSADAYEKQKHLVASFENSVGEKLESIRELDNLIAETKSELEELMLALNYCVLLNDILDTAKYGERPANMPNYNETSVIYGGIEITRASKQDIV